MHEHNIYIISNLDPLIPPVSHSSFPIHDFFSFIYYCYIYVYINITRWVHLEMPVHACV